jgi:hypothetical protein
MGAGGSPPTSKGAWPVKVVPAPASPALCSVIAPPINVINCRLMASPNPVPPKRRAIELSSWLNGWKQLHLFLRRDANA